MHDETPRVRAIDCTIPLLLQGYPYLSRQCREFRSDVFRGRLAGQPALFLMGRDAVDLVYDESRFRRADAVPALVKKTLFGQGGVQGLDDGAHRKRKAMFMAMMTKPRIARFLELLQEEWNVATRNFEGMARVVLDEEAQVVFARAACRWSGIAIDEQEGRRIARDCSALFTSFVSLGPRMWRARLSRKRAEAWARKVIERVRSSERAAEESSAAYVIAHHREPDGTLLSVQVAAVELINIIRPITAISRWVTWMAVALREHPEYAERVRHDDVLLDAFVQEVRRVYPFTPLLAARARRDFEWRGTLFKEGELAVLDVYGTLRDRRIWGDDAELFRPERFVDREPTAFDFVPHGGGDFFVGHRCAGEWLSIEAMKLSARVLTRQIGYVLPAQDLSYPLQQIPARPRSGVVLSKVQTIAEAPVHVAPWQLRGADGAHHAPH